MTDTDLLIEAYKRGAAWNPDYPNLANLDEGRILSMTGNESDAKDLMASRQASDGNMALLVAAFHAGRQPQFDGEIGPATRALVDVPRCPIPDYPPPPHATFHYDDPDLQKLVEDWQRNAATGSGSFPAGCHGTKFNADGQQTHEVTYSVDFSKAPAIVKNTWWPEIKKQLHLACALAGIRLIEVPLGQPAQIRVFWRSFAGGTIGMAEFNNRTCNHSVFCSLSQNYAPSIAAVIVLILHELGHNLNLQHLANSIMNPSIIVSMPPWWVRWNEVSTATTYEDRRWPTLRPFFGGRPVTAHGVTPTPPPGPTPTPTPQQKLWLRSAPAGTFEVVALRDFEAKAGDVLARTMFVPYQEV